MTVRLFIRIASVVK